MEGSGAEAFVVEDVVEVVAEASVEGIVEDVDEGVDGGVMLFDGALEAGGGGG